MDTTAIYVDANYGRGRTSQHVALIVNPDRTVAFIGAARRLIAASRRAYGRAYYTAKTGQDSTTAPFAWTCAPLDRPDDYGPNTPHNIVLRAYGAL